MSHLLDVHPGVQDQTVNEGDTAFFTCQVTGTPIPNISWYLNGVLVDKTNTMKYMISDMSLNLKAKSSTLAVRNVVSSDIGTYTCYAFNYASSNTSSGMLNVHGKDVVYQICDNCTNISANCYFVVSKLSMSGNSKIISVYQCTTLLLTTAVK